MRRYYLCSIIGTGIGTGADEDPFRPAVADYGTDWGMIDLRPDSTKSLGLAVAYLDSPAMPINPKIILLTDDLLSKTLATKNILNNALGIALTKETLPDLLAELLQRPPFKLCKALQPMQDGKYRIYLGEQIWGEPPPVYKQGTITDNFNRAELGPDWTAVDGTWTIQTNELYTIASGSSHPTSARHNTALTSADHYSQIIYTWGSGTTAFMGPAVRFSTSAETCYAGFVRSNGATGIYKILNTTGTILVSGTGGGAPPRTLKIQVSGSAIEFYNEGVLSLSTTDTNITGNLNVGVIGHRDTDKTGDDFEASELAAPPAGIPRQMDYYMRRRNN